MEKKQTFKQVVTMMLLIIAGETIFMLPFVLVRVFRPTVLEVFGLNNLELGLAFSVYGIIAVFSYFLGGPLADKYPAKNLISIALVMTGIGGLFLSTLPKLTELKLLYGFWGGTTILLFWAALIRATREWGSSTMQGTAFGLLEGGRGLTAALISSAAVAIFAFFLPEEVEASTFGQKTEAYRKVVLFVSAFIFLVSILAYFVLPKGRLKDQTPSNVFLTKGLVKVIQMRVIWLQAIIIVSAYVGYKITDDFSLFAREVLFFDEVEAASIGTISLWIRFVVAILAGLIADRLSISKMTMISFLFMLVGGIFFSSGLIKPGLFWLFFLNIVSIGIGIYALRGLYFAIMQEGGIPLMYTGTAVGLMSVIGYTPDIFMGPLMGYLLDSNPGPLGHQHVFVILVISSLIGLFTSIWYRKMTKK